jgi:hypothetical protein
VLPDKCLDAAEDFRRVMSRLTRVARFVATAWASVAASSAAALVAFVLHLSGVDTSAVRVLALAAFLLVATAATTTWWRRWTLVRVAHELERRAGGLDNVIVTAAEAIESPRRPLHPVLAAAVWEAAQHRLPAAAAQAPGVMGPLAAAVLCMVAGGATIWSLGPAQDRPRGIDAAGAVPESRVFARLGDVRVRVTPPAYTGRAPFEAVNPESITVLEGSRVRVDVIAADRVQIIDPGQAAVDLERDGDLWTHTFTPAASRVLLLQPRAMGEPRLLHVRVDPDRRPIVRIQAPARDLVLPDAHRRIQVEIAAEDDLALAQITLRYTRVAGSGESFTFEEGDLPLETRQASTAAWHGRATLALDGLKLDEGDTLVYRALARDGVPNREPSASETYIIEIGRLAGVASTGFAVPEERDRQALSQQMVIIKTERLHAARAAIGPDALLEQSRLLAVEQRMVRAEFVFMTGGHVEDEVAEAEAGHEIVEGRQENEAQVELLKAIREMSRAEARLNDGETAQALVFERAALQALQRAFDRRRYLLRTLPERTRIDPGRRLTGDRQDARETRLATAAERPDPVVAAARAVLGELTDAADTVSASAALAARIVAVDPAHAELQHVALNVAAASGTDARRAARRDAQRVLAGLMRSRLGAPPRGVVRGDSLSGHVADALERRRR